VEILKANSRISNKSFAISLFAILFFGVLTLANPYIIPVAEASHNANLIVSAENPAFSNSFVGPMVIEVVIDDPSIDDTNIPRGEPDVTVNGKNLRMVQEASLTGVDAKWYGYFADFTQATGADSLVGLAGTGLDFGLFCDRTSTIFGPSFSDTRAIAIPRTGGVSGGTDGTGFGQPFTIPVCTGSATASSLENHVVRAPMAINTDPAVAPGQIGLDPDAWPIVQLYDFAPTGNVIVQYNKGGGAQSTTLTFDSIPSSIDLSASRTSVTPASQVLLTLSDIHLNIDPTDKDSWTWATTSGGEQIFYQLFDSLGEVDADGTAGAVDLSSSISSFEWENDARMTLNAGTSLNLANNAIHEISVPGDISTAESVSIPPGSQPLTFLEDDKNTGVFENFVFPDLFPNLLFSNIVVPNGAPIGSNPSISYNPTVVLTVDAHLLSMTNPRLLDNFGNPVSVVGVGDQVQIAADFSNNSGSTQNFAYSVEVVNSAGTTVSLAWIQGAVIDGQFFTPSLSWIPDTPGEYTANIRLWEAIDDPFAKALPLSLPITVFDKVWDGGGDGVNWSDPLNWSANVLPVGTDDITLVGTSPFPIGTVLDIPFTITTGSLTIEPGELLSTGIGIALTNNSPVGIILEGTYFQSGPLNNGPGALFTITNGGELNGVQAINNDGTIVSSGKFGSNGAITNTATGIIINNSPTDTFFIGNSVLTNDGLFQNFGQVLVSSVGSIINTGIIENDVTSIVFENWGIIDNGDVGGITPGTITNNGILRNGDVLGNTPGTINNNPNSSITNSQTIDNRVNSIIDNDGTITSQVGSFFINNLGGIITNNPSGTITIDTFNASNQPGAIINNDGLFEILPLGQFANRDTFNNGGTIDIGNSGIFSNNDAAILSSTGNILGGSTSSFTNQVGATVTNNGDFTSSGFVNNFGTFTNNLQLTIIGTFTNNGILLNSDTGSLRVDGTSFGTLRNNNSFTNNGVIDIDPSGAIVNAVTGTFVNAEGTINISGFIINRGTFSNETLLTLDFSTINNDGSIQNFNGAIFNNNNNFPLTSSVVILNNNAAGIITNLGDMFEQGRFTNNGLFSNNAGGVFSQTGFSQIQNNNQITNRGIIGASSSGLFDNNAGATITNLAGGFINSANFGIRNFGTIENVNVGTVFEVTGSFSNEGTGVFENFAEFLHTGGGVNNVGTFNNNPTGIITTSGSSSFSNNGGLLDNSGMFTHGSAGTFSNTGTVSNQAGGAINLIALTVNDGTYDNAGIIAVASIATFNNNNIINNLVTGIISNPLGIIQNNSGGTINNDGNIVGRLFLNLGSITNNNGGTITNPVGVISTWNAVINNDLGGLIANDGTIQLDGNGVINNDSAINNNPTGIIQGAGVINEDCNSIITDTGSITVTIVDVCTTLEIIKVTTGGDDTFNFEATGPTTVIAGITTIGGTGSSTAVEVPVGTYSAQETVIPAGWTLDTASCTDGSSIFSVDTVSGIVITLGDDVVCTFENIKDGTIIIVKDTIPVDTTLFTFTSNTLPDQNGASAGVTQLDDDGNALNTFSDTETFSSLAPGTFDVAETPNANYITIS